MLIKYKMGKKEHNILNSILVGLGRCTAVQSGTLIETVHITQSTKSRSE